MRTLKLVTLLCGGLSLFGCNDSQPTSNDNPNPVSPPVAEVDFQAMLEQSVAVGIPGIVLYIDSPTLQFYGAAGLADKENTIPMTTDARIPNGSAGKKVTALLMAMLHEQQLLDLDAPISDYLSDELLQQIENSDEMYVRQLLNHTAGLYDYLNDANGEFFAAVLQQPDLIKTDSFALQFALNQDANFKPGAAWKYSNTGYLLAGLIMDKVLGEHHSKAMREYIFEPFGLSSMSYGGIEKAFGEIASGYFVDDEGNEINTQPYYANIGVADAPIVSTAKDLGDLFKIMITSPDIPAKVRGQLLGDSVWVDTDVTGQQYSMGIFSEHVGNEPVYHHNGAEIGYATLNWYLPSKNMVMSAIINCQGYNQCNTEIDKISDKLRDTLFGL
ncbi:serine hydrolase domain-containing protein [Pseudoalteromonas piscicida]|uniref:serine hydrolase domain-containing protein n=1 Tax=Pseudoalteromonas piscicida TaxID=43662 RepID=UPI0027393C33|nr:serine hydrolase domain-containing protein [Pseudoalteromonas piscicida]MDP4489210.1 serine hydrolase domain-containing protein [Pseudoalteromonas piscicida]